MFIVFIEFDKVKLNYVATIKVIESDKCYEMEKIESNNLHNLLFVKIKMEYKNRELIIYIKEM